MSVKEDIYKIVSAVELGDITRAQANEFIIDALLSLTPLSILTGGSTTQGEGQ